MKSLILAIQEELRAIPDSTRLASLPRGTSLYKQGQPVESLFLIEEGLLKLTRSNEQREAIIVAVSGPGQVVGEEALAPDSKEYFTDAAALTPLTAVRIPRASLVETLSRNPVLSTTLVSYLLSRKMDLVTKVELLCLHDVEYRILHYIQQLSSLVGNNNGEESQIPITQLELADLVGATRETTSTTLNQLERRGVIKLSRRLLIVPSPETLLAAASGAEKASLTASVNGSR